MRTYTTRLSALVAALSIVGCGGGGGVAEDRIDEAFTDTVCEMIRRCPGGEFGELALIVNAFEAQTSATCGEIIAAQGLSAVPRELDGVEDGTIAYDGGAMRRCLDQIADACLPFEAFQYIEACREIFVGQIPVGGECRTSAECAPGAYCDAEFSCSGTCLAQLAPGAACDRDEECPSVGDGLGECESTDANPEDHCITFTVTGGAALGDVCGNVSSGTENPTYVTCGAGLYCRDGEEISTCAAPLAPSEPCDEDDFCENGFCNEGVCVTPTIQTTAGATCSFEDAIVCDGSQHLGCSEAGTCEEVGDGTLGSPCTLDDDELLPVLTCDAGLYCDFERDTPSCQAKKALGATCDGNRECESGVCEEDECVLHGELCDEFIEI